jgi:hypothetical protein
MFFCPPECQFVRTGQCKTKLCWKVILFRIAATSFLDISCLYYSRIWSLTFLPLRVGGLNTYFFKKNMSVSWKIRIRVNSWVRNSRLEATNIAFQSSINTFLNFFIFVPCKLIYLMAFSDVTADLIMQNISSFGNCFSAPFLEVLRSISFRELVREVPALSSWLVCMTVMFLALQVKYCVPVVLFVLLLRQWFRCSFRTFHQNVISWQYVVSVSALVSETCWHWPVPKRKLDPLTVCTRFAVYWLILLLLIQYIPDSLLCLWFSRIFQGNANIMF